ncbi:hypothetical protein BCR35DRAFT_332396 [Leucosporidium creatinivorum]|uniref:Uncharacterized protein n=1 Tax=Leucosporidium creatinivorum TaxID=106004 RepID=A0A1Y2F3G5_9BASI|nr:hypothetical protein BCR35DRAFT_332396 [Leucosporidium creatinivorum]
MSHTPLPPPAHGIEVVAASCKSAWLTGRAWLRTFMVFLYLPLVISLLIPALCAQAVSAESLEAAAASSPLRLAASGAVVGLHIALFEQLSSASVPARKSRIHRRLRRQAHKLVKILFLAFGAVASVSAWMGKGWGVLHSEFGWIVVVGVGAWKAQEMGLAVSWELRIGLVVEVVGYGLVEVEEAE